MTDQDVYDFISNYVGDENFLKSLKEYYNKNKKLSYRQISSISINKM